MSQVTRDGFIDTFKAQGGLDLTALDAQAAGALQQAGIGADALAQLGGTDHHIDSSAELGRLFDLIDRVDHDGNARSIETTKTTADGQALATASGAVYDALKNHLESARLGAGGSVDRTSKQVKMPSAATVQKSLAEVNDHGFTTVHLTPTPYFDQGQKPWKSISYPKTPPEMGVPRTLKEAGCAPCALAMADCALRGPRTSPQTTADFAVRNGVSGKPGGSGTDTAGLVKQWGAANGLDVTLGASADQSKNVAVLKAGLEAGGVALVSVGVDAKTGHGHFTDGGHVMVINGCAMKDGQEWFAVVNPGRTDQSTRHKDLLCTDADVVQVDGATNGVGSVWISRTQLEAEMKRCFVLRSGGEA